MRVLVVTVVHHPLDARVYTREIGALVAAGHTVTYAAPWSSFAVEPPAGVIAIDLPRAIGRRRLQALRAARALLRRESEAHEILLLHNPELILAVIQSKARRKSVLDLHEDLAAALVDKSYLPGVTRRPLSTVVRWSERWAERNLHLILAEYRYQARFVRNHPVVPNETVVPSEVPPPGSDRVVYLGRVSEGRGLHEMIAVASQLPNPVRLEILGWGDDAVIPALREATATSRLTWAGRVGNQEALKRVEGAIAGLSLLQNLPNYRHSRPTKIVEYMARGIPVITTPLPVAVEIVQRYRCGVIVPFGDVAAVVEAIEELRNDADLREAMARRAHEAALDNFNWSRSAQEFVRILEAQAAEFSRGGLR